MLHEGARVVVCDLLDRHADQSVGKAFGVVSKIEWWARRITGVIFLLAGVFFSLRYCFNLPV